MKKAYPMYPGFIPEMEEGEIKVTDVRVKLGRALGIYNTFLSKKEKKFKQDFIHVVEEVIGEFDKTLNGWPISFQKRSFISALGQGRGLSVLVRACSLTGKKKYLAIGRKILKSFTIPTEEGGILSVDKCGCHWYEEDPSVPHLLNGFITSLIGLWEYYSYTKSKKAKKLFDMGISTLKNHLGDLTLDEWLAKWARYTKRRELIKKVYRPLLIDWMAALRDMTGDSFFGDYHRKWKSGGGWLKRLLGR